MRYRELARSGIRVSEIALGTVTFGHGVDAEGARRIFDKALDLGINLVDTADIYGEPFGLSETYLGAALAGHRDEVVLATKTGFPSTWEDDHTVSLIGRGGLLSRKSIVASLEASLRRLRTDYVDLFFLHWPDPVTAPDEILATLDILMRQGKILHTGLSWHAGWQVAKYAGICASRGYSRPTAVNDGYSLLDRQIEKELIPACADLSISVLPAFPLAGGLLTGKYAAGLPPPAGSRMAENPLFRAWLLADGFIAIEKLRSFAQDRGHELAELALAWLLAQPAVSSVVVGVTTIGQLESNVRAVDWSLTEIDLAEIDRIVPERGFLPRLF